MKQYLHVFICFEFHLSSSFLTLKASVNALSFDSCCIAIIKRDSSNMFYYAIKSGTLGASISVSVCNLSQSVVLCNLSELNEGLFL